MNIGIGIVFTDRYCFAIKHLMRAIRGNITHAAKLLDKKNPFVIYLAHDGSDEAIDSVALFQDEFDGKVKHKFLTDLSFKESYKVDSQISIARLESTVFDMAKDDNVDMFWSLEPDILPPDNALRCLINTLQFDDGYYSIAFATYPSQGGGSFLGGHGSPHRHIEEDFIEEERKLSDKFNELKASFDELAKQEPKDHDKLKQIATEIQDELKKCPPAENVFGLNARKWRRRGWLDFAYPAIGKGAMLPTDWTGMGCTLISNKALMLSNFIGYEGKGTQDLYLTWSKWHPHGLRSAVVTHCPCSHVCRERAEDGTQDFSKLFLLYAHHEEEGETRGHLRVSKRDFIDC